MRQLWAFFNDIVGRKLQPKDASPGVALHWAPCQVWRWMVHHPARPSAPCCITIPCPPFACLPWLPAWLQLAERQDEKRGFTRYLVKWQGYEADPESENWVQKAAMSGVSAPAAAVT